MPVRRLPVRPDLEQLHRQAKELLRAIHVGDANGIAELREHHPESIDPAAAKLTDAQLALARSYRASSWTRLVQAVQLADANSPTKLALRASCWIAAPSPTSVRPFGNASRRDMAADRCASIGA